MAFDGAGTFNRVHDWTADRDAGIKIRADRHDAEDDGFATGLTTCVTKDGQTTITANLPMAGFRHTGVGNASARNHYGVVGQLQDGSYVYAAAAGTADALTLNIIPSITAYVTGLTLIFKAAADNTTAATLDVDSVGAKAIRKVVSSADVALGAGDIQQNGIYTVTYDEDANSAAGGWLLQNPSNSPEHILTTRGDQIRRGATAPERFALGTNGQVQSSDDTDVVWADLTRRASAQGASGAAITFSGTPSWVKEIVIMFEAVSLDGTAELLVRIGDSGGAEATGYSGAYSRLTASAASTTQFSGSAFVVDSLVAAGVISGTMTLRNITGNKWIATGLVARTDAAVTVTSSGVKELTATLDRVEISPATGNLDAGNLNIMYR